MFAQIGSVAFEVLGPLTDFDSRREHQYAEHAPIEGKPRLQYIGTGLEEVSVRYTLNEWYCDPLVSQQALDALAARAEAVPFVWGDGRLQGRFVVREVEYTVQQADGTGYPRRISGSLSLTEWAALPGEGAGQDPAPAVTDAQPAGAKTSLPNRPPSTDPRTVPATEITRGGAP